MQVVSALHHFVGSIPLVVSWLRICCSSFHSRSGNTHVPSNFPSGTNQVHLILFSYERFPQNAIHMWRCPLGTVRAETMEIKGLFFTMSLYLTPFDQSSSRAMRGGGIGIKNNSLCRRASGLSRNLPFWVYSPGFTPPRCEVWG